MDSIFINMGQSMIPSVCRGDPRPTHLPARADPLHAERSQQAAILPHHCHRLEGTTGWPTTGGERHQSTHYDLIYRVQSS